MVARIDYMVDEPSDELKMVEFNLHSVGVHEISNLYNFLLKTVLIPNEAIDFKPSENYLQVAKLLGHGVDEYEKLYLTAKTTILFVTFANDLNILYYRHIEICLWKLGYTVKVRSLDQLGSLVKRDEIDNRLLIEGDEVSLVYFRTLPDETNFGDDNFESVIRPVELSRAIKVPDIGQVLISFKPFQQYFTQNGHVFERFNESCSEMRRVLMDLRPINDLNFVNQVLSKPQDYVLKLSYGEGGGGCLFGNDLKLKLEYWKDNWESSSFERSNFLLMKKILPPSIENIQVNQGYEWKRDLFNAEFGFYGGLISVDGKIITNNFIGSCVRSKRSQDNEVGLCASRGKLSSVIVENKNM